MTAAEALLDAQFSTAVYVLEKMDVPANRVAGALLDEWGAPPDLAKADRRMQPGDHGIPEIGRAEQAFYDALTAGQREAYNAIKDTVYALFRGRVSFDTIDPWTVDEPISAWKRNAFSLLLNQPLKAFMVGQLLASQFVENAKKKRVLMPTDKEAVSYLKAYAFSEIDAKFDSMKGTLRAALIDGIHEGKNPREVARAVSNAIKDYGLDLERIAITETARAESQGRLVELRAQGYDRVIGSSAHDPRTCPNCLKFIDGKDYAIADVIGKSNYGRKADERLPVIPYHPKCRCVWLPYSGVHSAPNSKQVSHPPKRIKAARRVVEEAVS